MQRQVTVRTALAGLSVLTVMAGCGFGYERWRAVRTNADLAAAQHQLAATEAEAARLRKAIRDAAAGSSQSSGQVPLTAEEPELLDEVAGLAQAAHVTVTGLTLTDTGTGGPAATATGAAATTGGAASPGQQSAHAVSVSLTATGTRAQLLDFLDRLQTGARLTVTRRAQVANPSSGSAKLMIQAIFPYAGKG
ncbi:hypothetical protein [Alicyclobacillus macrosporangiidus]|uniref:hypothetical protein n=1 Tax=Alicyclobacillus macrosporangiidus TaxID=392015 RepID=UPI000496963F|nr:hypothetical protein [Alicyclobacillus macrosporangiidus]